MISLWSKGRVSVISYGGRERECAPHLPSPPIPADILMIVASNLNSTLPVKVLLGCEAANVTRPSPQTPTLAVCCGSAGDGEGGARRKEAFRILSDFPIIRRAIRWGQWEWREGRIAKSPNVSPAASIRVWKAGVVRWISFCHPHVCISIPPPAHWSTLLIDVVILYLYMTNIVPFSMPVSIRFFLPPEVIRSLMYGFDVTQ